MAKIDSKAEQIDRDLAAAAIRKVQAGKVPTTREQRALKRIESAKEDELRWRIYASIPKRDYAELSGRQPKVLNDQADRYGAPLRGRTIDLGKLLRWLHGFLASHAKQLELGDDDADLLAGPASPALERLREERARLAQLQRMEREQTLLPRAEVHEVLGRIAGIIRGAAELLDNDGREVIAEALDDATREIDGYFGQTKTPKGDTDE